jgi:Periplasmic copper-binding protein (NosD)
MLLQWATPARLSRLLAVAWSAWLLLHGGIPAAAVTFVNSCPATLDQPGELYILGQSLSCSGTALRITASNVQLVLNGHTLTGDGSGAGIFVAQSVMGVQIDGGGEIRRFQCGIVMDSVTSCAVRALTVAENRVEGIFLVGRSLSNSLAGNFVRANGGGGIVLDATASHNILQGNVIRENGLEGIAIVGGGGATGNQLIGNVTTANLVGIFIGPGAHGNTVIGNQALQNGDFDLFDQNLPNCVNVWQGNQFQQDNELNGPAAGCIR